MDLSLPRAFSGSHAFLRNPLLRLGHKGVGITPEGQFRASLTPKAVLHPTIAAMLSASATAAAARGGAALPSEAARPRHGASFSQRVSTSTTALGSSSRRLARRAAVKVDAQASAGAGRYGTPFMRASGLGPTLCAPPVLICRAAGSF